MKKIFGIFLLAVLFFIIFDPDYRQRLKLAVYEEIHIDTTIAQVPVSCKCRNNSYTIPLSKAERFISLLPGPRSVLKPEVVKEEFCDIEVTNTLSYPIAEVTIKVYSQTNSRVEEVFDLKTSRINAHESIKESVFLGNEEYFSEEDRKTLQCKVVSLEHI